MLPDNATPQVSIIMPTFNRAGMIAAAIQSIRDQSFSDWELLIVDDGSTDATETVIAAINDPRIFYFRVAHCAKIGWLRNYGVAKARGTYIAFNDSDDGWHPLKLEKQLQALERNKDASFCLVNGYNYREQGQPLQYFYPQQQGEKCDDLFLSCFQSGVSCYTQTLLFYKSCFSTAGPFEDERISDRNFIVSLCFHFKGVILYEPLVYRLLHDGNINLTKWKRSYEYELELIGKHKAMLPKTIHRRALYNVYINYGEACLQRRKKLQAARMFIRAGKIKPFSFIPVKKLGKTLLY